jgi:hypothetical protein
MTGPSTKTLHLLAEAQALRRRGLSLSAIARQLGVSKQYVGQMLGKVGQPSPWTAENLALLGRMPDRTLAKRLGCT